MNPTCLISQTIDPTVMNIAVAVRLTPVTDLADKVGRPNRSAAVDVCYNSPAAGPAKTLRPDVKSR